MSGSSTVTVEALGVSAYVVPTDAPEADGTAEWDSTGVVVVEPVAAGRTGLGWSYADPAAANLIAHTLAPCVSGRSVDDVAGTTEALRRRCRNLGRPGLAATAISAIDLALWDLKAKLLDLPLARLLGRAHEQVAVYGSGGFPTYDDARTAEQLRGWVQGSRIPRVKIKIGESWGRRCERDLERVALARSVIGEDVELFVDANGGYSVGQAVRMGRRFADYDVVWFEEPVSSDDLEGLRAVRGQVPADVAAGEYAYDVYDARRLCEGAVDCLQLDATRCGGVTGWLQGAAIAAAYNLQVSAHCAPTLHAPIAAAAPNLRHIEYFHDHVRIEHLLFDGAPEAADGVLPSEWGRPGLGVGLRRERAEEFRVR